VTKLTRCLHFNKEDALVQSTSQPINPSIYLQHPVPQFLGARNFGNVFFVRLCALVQFVKSICCNRIKVSLSLQDSGFALNTDCRPTEISGSRYGKKSEIDLTYLRSKASTKLDITKQRPLYLQVKPKA